MTTEKIAELSVELDRVGALVLTETGQFEHLYAGHGKTLCGREVDNARVHVNDSYWECLKCRASRKSGGEWRAGRALRSEIAALSK